MDSTPVSLRSILIAVVCIFVICAISPTNNYLTGAAWIAADQFSIGVIALLSLLIVLVTNIAWRGNSAQSRR